MSDTKNAIAVLVASSRTGLQLVQQGLERGYNVRAVVRSEAKFRSLVEDGSILDNPNLTIFACQLDSVRDITPPLTGAQVVFVAAGGTEFKKPAYINQDIVITILTCLQNIDRDNRPQRIVFLSSETISKIAKVENIFIHRVMYNLMTPVFEDLIRTEKLLKQNQDKIKYTFIQPNELVSAPKTNGVVKLVDGGRSGPATSYSDLATAMLDASMDKSCENAARAVVSDLPPKPDWQHFRWQLATAFSILNFQVFTPVVKTVLWVGLGYMLKSKVFADRTFTINGIKI